VIFLVDEPALKQVFSEFYNLSPAITITPLLHINLSPLPEVWDSLVTQHIITSSVWSLISGPAHGRSKRKKFGFQ
jgi:hypothetical protein